jgi:hypothetical protein
MSRSVDLFIDAAVALDELAAALGALLGTALVAEADQAAWLLREGAMQATLAEHPYRDDGNLPFTRYRYALSARVSNDVRPHDTPEAAMLRRVAYKVQQGPNWPVLLVHDLQYRERLTAAATPNGAGAAT